MKFGLYGINTGVCSEPEAALRVARAAENAGFDSVWTAEHVVLPDPQAPPSPAPPHMKLLDPAVALAFIAAQTTTLRLAHRNHHPAAAQSRGAREGARERRPSVEGATHLRARRGLLEAGVPGARRAVRRPRPAHRRVHRGDPRALDRRTSPSTRASTSRSAVSSHSRVRAVAAPSGRRRRHESLGACAARRATETAGTASRSTSTRRDARSKGCAPPSRDFDRDAALGRLEITVTPPPGKLDLDAVHGYAALGVDRLVLLNPGRTADDQIAAIERAERELVRPLAE